MVTPPLRCWCAAFKGELNHAYVALTERDCRRRVIDAGFASEDEAKRSHVWPLLQSRGWEVVPVKIERENR